MRPVVFFAYDRGADERAVSFFRSRVCSTELLIALNDNSGFAFDGNLDCLLRENGAFARHHIPRMKLLQNLGNMLHDLQLLPR